MSYFCQSSGGDEEFEDVPASVRAGKSPGATSLGVWSTRGAVGSQTIVAVLRAAGKPPHSDP